MPEVKERQGVVQVKKHEEAVMEAVAAGSEFITKTDVYLGADATQREKEARRGLADSQLRMRGGRWRRDSWRGGGRG